jgi:hypothetical protein
MTGRNSITGGPAAPTHKGERTMTERLLTVQEAGELLNTGERFRVG